MTFWDDMGVDMGYVLQIMLPIMYWLLVASVTFRLIMKRQVVSVTLAWLMVIFLFPFIGVFLYLIIGEVYLGKERAKNANAMMAPFYHWVSDLNAAPLVLKQASVIASPLFKLCQQRLSIPCLMGNELHLLDNAETALKSVVSDIDKAEDSIKMVFYIWHNGGLVDEVKEALIRAQARGVDCHIMLDSVGSSAFFKSKVPAQMRAAGIHIIEALHVSPIRMFFRRMDLRQHRKIIVVDNVIAYTGSMNMVDPAYFKQGANVGQWIDVMVRMDGPIAAVLNGLHAWDWEIETGQRMLPPHPTHPAIEVSGHNSHAVQLLATGPGFPEDLMNQSLLSAIYAATTDVVITTPYFVPSGSLVEALKVVSYRGVKVKLIVPKHNDSTMVKWASRAYFDELLAAGVEIHQFTGDLLHTKSVLVDDQLSMVGTVNMDIRSLWLNLEVTIAVDDPLFASEVALLQEGYLNQSERLDVQQWAARPFRKKLLEKLFFIMSPLL